MTLQVLHSAMVGAPTISGQSGTLTTMLKACLVDGFGLVTLDSLVVAGGIATATRAAGHSAEVGGYQTIAGATPGGLNGEKVVLSATVNTFTFDATGISDQTATGTITAKVTPLGWTREFNATNVEVFRSPNVAGTRHYLRVDDGGAEPRDARVVSYETMSDVSTGTNPSPSAAQLSGGGFWTKSNGANSTVRNWVLAGDDRTFYLSVSHSGNSAYSTYAYGDIESFKNGGDAYANLLQCAAVTLSVHNSGSREYDVDYMDSETTTHLGAYLSRSYTGLGSSILGKRGMPFSMSTNTTSARSGGSGLWQYPNGPDGGLYLTRPLVFETTLAAIRGRLRGIHVCPQAIGNATFSHLEEVTGVTGLSGRKLKAVNSNSGVFFYDRTGPW